MRGISKIRIGGKFYFFNVRLRMKFHTVIGTRPQKRILIMNYGLVFGLALRFKKKILAKQALHGQYNLRIGLYVNRMF